MAIVVVGSSGRNVGKTSLICGLIEATPGVPWTAVKISGHPHEKPAPLWEEIEPGQGTDTARYLSAGARRAFLITATDAQLPGFLQELEAKIATPRSLIFESNRIVDWVQPDLCLAVISSAQMTSPIKDQGKPSFERFLHLKDATVVRGDCDRMTEGSAPLFELADLAHLSVAMRIWLRTRLALD
jgi:hypothetical protein